MVQKISRFCWRYSHPLHPGKKFLWSATRWRLHRCRRCLRLTRGPSLLGDQVLTHHHQYPEHILFLFLFSRFHPLLVLCLLLFIWIIFSDLVLAFSQISGHCRSKFSPQQNFSPYPLNHPLSPPYIIYTRSLQLGVTFILISKAGQLKKEVNIPDALLFNL